MKPVAILLREKYYKVPKEELLTISLIGDEELTENKLRAEHGLPNRATYGK